MRIIENKKIDKKELRAMCIKNNLYDGSTSEDYDNLFKMSEGEVTAEKLYNIAVDIAEHSTSHWQTDNEVLAGLMYLINKYAVRTTYKIEE